MEAELKSAVVTGVSTGIGRAISARLIDDGWQIFGSVRKESDAESVKGALGDSFTPLIFDVTDHASVKAAAKAVESQLAGRTLDGLVNNAGISAAGPMRYVPIDELRAVMEVNGFGVVSTCQAFISLLGADRNRMGAPGKIINISSLGGRISVPFMGPYSMSKFAVEAMSDALRVELLPHGIDVVVIEPGPVKTPIFEKTEAIDFDQYANTEYATGLERMVASSEKLAKDGLEPEEIGKLVAEIFNNPSPKPRYPVLKKKFSRWIIPRLIRRRRLDQILAKRMGLTPR